MTAIVYVCMVTVDPIDAEASLSERFCECNCKGLEEGK
jgi:hypothetical protein